MPKTLKTNPPKKLSIFQAKNGAIELKLDSTQETFWASQKQIAEVFGVDRTVVTRHINNIFKDEELDKKVVCANFTHTTEHGAIKGKTQSKQTTFYNLDIILAIGYRTKSTTAIKFRRWATQTLKQHITKGYTINKKRLKKNHEEFLKTIEDIKLLTKDNKQISNDQIIELIKTFSPTWFQLESYDKQTFPKKGNTKKNISLSAKELKEEIEKLKNELIVKKQATNLFAQEKKQGSLEGIIGNIFQSAFGKEVYETVEEKAAHVLYFVIKNHPFVDGNKRTGAFSFIWFLQKMKFNFIQQITPETLTILALMVAESDPKEKDKIIGLILLILKK